MPTWTNITISGVSKELHDKVDHHAHRLGLKRAEFIRKMLQRTIEQLDYEEAVLATAKKS